MPGTRESDTLAAGALMPTLAMHAASLGQLPTRSTLLQDGDQVFMLVTDDMIGPVTKITSAAPEGGH